MDVFDADGTRLGELPLSEKQSSMLEAGELVTVMFHTPQRRRLMLGERSGSFTLRKIDGKVVTPNVAAMKEYIALQTALRGADQ